MSSPERIDFLCGSCGVRLRGKRSEVGSTIPCPQCGKPVAIREVPLNPDQTSMLELLEAAATTWAKLKKVTVLGLWAVVLLVAIASTLKVDDLATIRLLLTVLVGMVAVERLFRSAD